MASTVADEEMSPLGSRIPAEEIERALKTLSERERKVIELRYGLKGEGPWTCEEIGRYYGITARKIKHFENQAHRKLREASVFEEDLVGQWNTVFPEGKARRLSFQRGRGTGAHSGNCLTCQQVGDFRRGRARRS